MRFATSYMRDILLLSASKHIKDDTQANGSFIALIARNFHPWSRTSLAQKKRVLV